MLHNAINFQGLKKTFHTLRGPVQALRGLDLQVKPGEIFGYIGVNGAGKSTSIKVLLGLIRPSAGGAWVFGEPAGSLAARRKIGYLPEVANYHEFMSAAELLMMHARLAGVPRALQAERCREALELVGLSTRKHSRISEYSKGMKQRVGVAQALVSDPPLLILDELTSGLDPFAQRDLRDIMLRLKERNITVFFSSHHMNEVESICDRAAIIHRGALQACGTIPELTENRERVEMLWEAVEVSEPVSQISKEGEASVARHEAHSFLQLAMSRGYQLKRMSSKRTNLEDVFHDITRRVDREASACSPS
ncbi:ABC transporter ATP-binding protein [bacterium]|nr:ABC transporter ATP-binding protein [bacterium]